MNAWESVLDDWNDYCNNDDEKTFGTIKENTLTLNHITRCLRIIFSTTHIFTKIFFLISSYTNLKQQVFYTMRNRKIFEKRKRNLIEEIIELDTNKIFHNYSSLYRTTYKNLLGIIFLLKR